jgi:hypothetical protein
VSGEIGVQVVSGLVEQIGDVLVPEGVQWGRFAVRNAGLDHCFCMIEGGRQPFVAGDDLKNAVDERVEPFARGRSRAEQGWRLHPFGSARLRYGR